MTHLISRPVVAPRDAQVVEHLDMLCRIVLSGADTGGAFSLVEERARFGACTPRHLHTREAETFMVLDGALEGWCDGTATLVDATRAGSQAWSQRRPLRGHCLLIPSGLPFGLGDCRGHSPLRKGTQTTSA